MNINQNIAECIKEISNIGSTTYVNICDNTSQVVPWGSADWLGVSFIALFVLGFVSFIIALIRSEAD